MGWASGSDLMSEIIAGCKKKKLDDKTRLTVYKICIDALEGEDWDTQDECIGEDPMYDNALYAIHRSSPKRNTKKTRTKSRGNEGYNDACVYLEILRHELDDYLARDNSRKS